jgi:hypothetical protein
LNKLQLLRRRPSASIAWDSLNESREDNLMREVAPAVPFNWEEAPGKAAAAHHSITAESGELQGASRRTGTSGAAQEQLREVEAKDSEAAPRDPEANQETKISGTDYDRDHASSNSFRSSRRYYSRMSSRISDRSMSFGASSSCNSDQFADQTHQLAVPHIDLVAPAAARFLAESAKTNTVLDSRIATPPGKHVLSVPFKWEEAPGKPKVDDSTVAAAAGAPDLQRETSTTPPSLQLPPALLATLHMKLGAGNTSRSTAAESDLATHVYHIQDHLSCRDGDQICMSPAARAAAAPAPCSRKQPKDSHCREEACKILVEVLHSAHCLVPSSGQAHMIMRAAAWIN